MDERKSDEHHKTLFGGGGDPLENRKLLNFWARFLISLANAVTFVILLWLLFFAEVKEASRDLVNILWERMLQSSLKSQITGLKIKETRNMRNT